MVHESIKRAANFSAKGAIDGKLLVDPAFQKHCTGTLRLRSCRGSPGALSGGPRVREDESREILAEHGGLVSFAAGPEEVIRFLCIELLRKYIHLRLHVKRSSQPLRLEGR